MRVSARHLAVPVILLGLFITNSVNIAATNGTNLVFVRSDIGFSSACSYYEIKNSGLVELKEDKLKTLKLGNSVELKGKGYTSGIKEVIGKIKNPVWEYLYTKTYDCSYDNWVSKVTCEKIYDPVNKTDYENCTDNGHFEFIEKECEEEFWINALNENLKDIKVQPAGDLQVRFCADIERGVTEDGWVIRVDHIPEFDGIEYKEYAWWDNSYSYRYLINSNSTDTTNSDIIAVNDTGGIDGTIVWTRNATAGEDIYLYCVNSGCASGSIAIANETDEKAWFSETDGTGNNADGVSVNMIAWLTFNNVTGTDVSGSGNNFTAVGTPTTTDGVFYNGTDLDGSTDAWKMLDADADDFEGGAEQTVTAWVYPTAAPGGAGQLILTKTSVQYIRRSLSGTDIKFTCYFATADADTAVAGEDIPQDAWMHVACTYDGSDMTLYQDGNQTNTSSAPGGNLDTSTYDLGIGWTPIGNSDWFPGVIDDLRVYDKGLTPMEIQDLYYQGKDNHTSLGAEEATMSLTLRSPTNTSYATTSIKINGTISESANITWSEDGGANQTACESCTEFENTTTLAEGAHNIFVYVVAATDDTITTYRQTFFAVDLSAPVVIIEDPTGTYQTNATIPLNFTASDALSTVDECWYSLNNATNVSIGSCANTTFAVTQAGTHNISVYANDTLGWEGVESSSFAYDPLQNFTANDSMTGEQIQDFQVLIIETGASGSTTNGTAPILSSAVGYGTQTVRFIALGYNTTDFSETFTNESLLAKNFTLVPAFINITVLDEADAAIGVTTNITFNITISNATQSNTWYNESTFFQYTNATATGSVTISISSYGYQPREYYITINENIANKFTAYLLKTADALFVRFHALTVEGLGISGAEVSAERAINGTWTLMEEKTSDDAGIAGLSLAAFAAYRVTASATGYVTQVQSITPSASDYYFYLASSSNVSYHVLFEDITYFVTPQDPTIKTNVSYDMVFNITSSNSTLEWYSMNITYNDTTAVFFLNVTGNAGGGNITFELNSSYASGNYTMEIKFKKTDYAEWTAQYHYQIRNFVTRVGSLWYFLQQFAASDAPPMFKHLVAIFTAFASAGVASKMGMRGGGVLAGIVLIIWTGAGWFSWNIMLLTVLSVLAAYALKEGL